MPQLPSAVQGRRDSAQACSKMLIANNLHANPRPAHRALRFTTPIPAFYRAAMKTLLVLGFASFAASSRAVAEVRLHPLWSDHAVLQRDRPLPVRGEAAPGEIVRVRLGVREALATAGADGAFLAVLEARSASPSSAC